MFTLILPHNKLAIGIPSGALYLADTAFIINRDSSISIQKTRHEFTTYELKARYHDLFGIAPCNHKYSFIITPDFDTARLYSIISKNPVCVNRINLYIEYEHYIYHIPLPHAPSELNPLENTMIRKEYINNLFKEIQYLRSSVERKHAIDTMLETL